MEICEQNDSNSVRQQKIKTRSVSKEKSQILPFCFETSCWKWTMVHQPHFVPLTDHLSSEHDRQRHLDSFHFHIYTLAKIEFKKKSNLDLVMIMPHWNQIKV